MRSGIGLRRDEPAAADVGGDDLAALGSDLAPIIGVLYGCSSKWTTEQTSAAPKNRAKALRTATGPVDRAEPPPRLAAKGTFLPQKSRIPARQDLPSGENATDSR